MELRDGQVAGSHKENRNPQSLQIVPLYDAVRQALADGVRTVVITPGWHTTFRLLAEAAYTTVTAGVSEIDIAVRNPDGSPGALPHYRAVRGEGAENQLVVLVKAGHLIALQDGGRTQLASLPHVSGPASACQSDELWCRETADGCSCPDLSGMYREMARFASASSMVHLTADLDIPFSVLGRVHSTLACKRPPGTTDDLRTFIATETLKASGGDGCEPLFRHITLAILE